jgi:hypothetical protein
MVHVNLPMYLPWSLRLTLLCYSLIQFILNLWCNNIIWIYYSQFYLSLLNKFIFGKMLCTKQSCPWFTTRTCWLGFSRLLLCSDHVWVVCLHWSFCSTNNCFPHLFHTTLMVMLWMSPRTFWPIAFSRSSSSLWLNDLSYLFDHAFEPISLLSFFNLDVVQNVRNTWKIVLHFLNNLITTLWELKNSRLAVIVIIDNKMTCVSLKCPM